MDPIFTENRCKMDGEHVRKWQKMDMVPKAFANTLEMEGQHVYVHQLMNLNELSTVKVKEQHCLLV